MARYARQILAVIVSIALIGLAGHSGQAAAAQGPATSSNVTAIAPSNVVNAVLSDMKVSVDRASVPAGDVTFLIRNNGSIVHELVLLKTGARFDALPPNPDEATKAFEDIHIGETGEMDIGAFGAFDAILGPGHYVLLCNEPGHYMAGMSIDFTVTDPELDVTLQESSMSVAQPTAMAGRVLLNVSNLSSAAEKVVVLRAGSTGDAATAIASHSVSAQTADVSGGRSARFAVDLGVGSYIIICVENGQYEMDSQATITVVPAPLRIAYTDPGGDTDQ